MKFVVKTDIVTQLDLLALNIDEAAAAVDMSSEERSTPEIIEQSVKKFMTINPEMFISVTAGKEGSWSWDGSSLRHIPGLKVQAKSTAGAGDAHLSGLIVGLTAGLSLSQAQELANLTSAFSVESEHTINKNLDGFALREFVLSRKIKICDEVRELLDISPRRRNSQQ